MDRKLTCMSPDLPVIAGPPLPSLLHSSHTGHTTHPLLSVLRAYLIQLGSRSRHCAMGQSRHISQPAHISPLTLYERDSLYIRPAATSSLSPHPRAGHVICGQLPPD